MDDIKPEKAMSLYLESKENEVAQATLYSHKSRLGHFLRWCEKTQIVTMSELDPAHLHQYRMWRRSEGDLNRVTEKTQMDTLRVFVRWCERMDYVQTDLHEAVVSPSLDDDDNARDVMLSDDRAEAALDYLATYDYASAAHVILLLMWGTGARVGALRAVDVGDYDSDGRVLEIRHRPNTPLKNKNRGERDVALKASTCTVVDDWLANRRPDSRDDDGRRPLLASEQGRMHTTTLRAYIYGYTRPCAVGMDCPHDRDPDRCEATEYDQASRCPSSVSPHAVRRGSITHWLRSDVPRPVVSDRMQVSEDVLDEHYDERNHREKMEVRRKFLDNI